jgi:hypothetical protein
VPVEVVSTIKEQEDKLGLPTLLMDAACSSFRRHRNVVQIINMVPTSTSAA